MFRMHRVAAGALLLLLAGCLREQLERCANGAYCPAPQVCTERAEAPFCGGVDEVTECLGKADEDACVFETDKKGYCNKGLCTACDPNFAFCRYDQWTQMRTDTDGGPITTELDGVWAASPTSVVAVGRTGTVIRWDGRTWSRITAVSSGADHQTIWGFGPTDFYVAIVGNVNGTRLFRYDGTWVPQTPAPANIVSALWGSSGRVFAAGAGGEIGHYDSSTWSYSTNGTLDFNGIWGTDANNAIAVGNGGTAYRYAGSWAPDPTGTTFLLRDIAGTGSVEFAVGNVSAVMKAPVVLRHMNNTWTDMSAMLPAVGNVIIHAVWVVSPTDVYAVGESGTILHYDGTAWTSMPSGVTVTLTEIFGVTEGAKTDLFAVGAAGTVLRLSR